MYRTLGAYGYFGEIAPTPGQIVTERVAAMVKVNDALWAALADFERSATSTDRDRIRWEVENWHTNAKKWMDWASEAAKDETKFSGWRTWGINLSRAADPIFVNMNRSNWGSAAKNFVTSFPAALGLVAKKTVTAVAEGAGEAAAAAGAGIGKTLLYVGIPLALIILLATSGGRSIGIGPVRLGKR